MTGETGNEFTSEVVQHLKVNYEHQEHREGMFISHPGGTLLLHILSAYTLLDTVKYHTFSHKAECNSSASLLFD